ncbi:MAG: winged helix-turn-helix domain-containing protein [Pyrinomonadaceae bacterium]
MEDKSDYYYEFGQYRVDSLNKLLLRNNKVVPLTPKLFDTLLILLENNGRVLSKKEFFNEIWTDTFVEESNLTQNIFQLRKTLGEGDFIETVPKRGYRFSAKVEVLPIRNLTQEDGLVVNSNKNQPDFSAINPQRFSILTVSRFRYLGLLFLSISLFSLGYFLSFSLPQSKTKVQGNISPNRSIAILPFKNIGGKTANETLEIGMTDALITKLGNLQKINVRPTGAVIEAKETEPIKVGHELNVDTVLSGTIQRDKDQIRVNVQLVRVSDGITLWADKYDASAKNIFDVQDNISEKIIRSLVSQLDETDNLQVNKRYTNNIEAYEAYSRGRYFWTTSSHTDLNKSLEYFQKAIELDPNFALAYSGLADLHIFWASNNTGIPSASEHLKLAKLNAQKALEIDNTLANPHTTLAAIIFKEKGNWNLTEKEFLKSIELNPNYPVAHHWYSLHLLSQGEFEKAESEMKKALEIDPVSPSMNLALGQIYFYWQRYDSALSQFEKTLELDPDFARANVYLAISLTAVGKKERAVSILEQVYREYPTHTHAKTALGCLYADSGRETDALRILDSFESMKTPSIYDKYGMAVINAHLRKTDKAFSILESISSYKNLDMIVRLKFDPKLDVLRNDKNFVQILNKKNIFFEGDLH